MKQDIILKYEEQKYHVEETFVERYQVHIPNVIAQNWQEFLGNVEIQKQTPK